MVAAEQPGIICYRWMASRDWTAGRADADRGNRRAAASTHRLEEIVAAESRVPVEVTFRNLEPSPAIETLVRQKAAKLAQFASRLMRCRVVVALPNRRHHQGKIFAVSIELELPSGSLWINRTPPMDHRHEDAHVAIQDAFDAAKRRLQDSGRKKDRRVKQHAERTRRRPARSTAQETED